ARLRRAGTTRRGAGVVASAAGSLADAATGSGATAFSQRMLYRMDPQRCGPRDTVTAYSPGVERVQLTRWPGFRCLYSHGTSTGGAVLHSRLGPGPKPSRAMPRLTSVLHVPVAVRLASLGLWMIEYTRCAGSPPPSSSACS